MDRLGSEHVGRRSIAAEYLMASREPITSGVDIEISERDVKPFNRKAFSLDDLVFILEWPVLRIAAATLPESRWSNVALWLERMKVRLGYPSPAKQSSLIQQALDLRSLKEAEAIAWQAAAGRTEHHIQVIKVMSAKGWTPTIHLEGEEHLKTALAGGKGAILWVGHFCFNTQATKMALKKAGYRVSHLSRPEHGYSKSQFGVRHLNPLRWNAELKYLDKRIIIDRGQRGGALQEAKGRAAGQSYCVDHSGRLGGTPGGTRATA